MKKKYTAPELEKFGTVSLLSAGGTGALNEDEATDDPDLPTQQQWI